MSDVITRLPVCADCGNRFERRSMSGPAAKRCPRCTQERTRMWSRRGAAIAKERRAEAREQRSRLAACQDCGAEIACARMGPKPKRCHKCRLKWKLVREYTPVSPTPISCQDCGKSAPRVAHGMTRKSCDDCTRRRGPIEWATANPEKRKAIERKAASTRRARKAGAGSEDFDEREVFDRDRWICGICRKRISKKLIYPHPRSVSLDHTIPLSQGGSHSRANTRPAHLECNVRRQDKGGNEQLLLVG